ncbi:MAG: hypothetical protein CME70_04230 [Halobacteriovorax sp.]|nr:hypothetical protein [Halobacteriovorax sp.]
MNNFSKYFLFYFIFTAPLFGEKPKGEAAVLKALCHFENANLASHINPYFLSKLPTDKLVGILKGFKSQEGKCVNIEKVDAKNFLYTTDKSQRAMQLYLDKNEKIRGLWFGNATSYGEKLSTVVDELKKLPGKTSLTYLKNGKAEILSHNPDLPLAIELSSSLFLLKLLSQKVDKTKLNWNSSLKLNSKFKSVPGGRLYDWPTKAPVTVQTLATMLMAYSDETAFDHVFNLVGRKNLEKASPRNRPFLKTLDYHKLRGDKVLGFSKKKIKEKREILNTLEKKSIEELSTVSDSFEIDSIGWFGTTKELCQIIHSLRNEPYAGVNPGLAQRGGWKAAAFKMGRAPGIIQYTQLVVPKSSKDSFCVSITWNNPGDEMEPSKIDSILSRILSKVK